MMIEMIQEIKHRKQELRLGPTLAALVSPMASCSKGIQWSSLAGFFFRPVGKLGQAFPPGLSR
jgi:hypothetical protein